jgi:hypothetical protein
MTKEIAGHKQTTLTSGYCTLTDFNTRTDENNKTNYYPCPINENPDAKETTSIDILIDAINSGVDTITNAIGADEEDEIKNSVDEFKCNVLDGTYDENTNSCDIDIKREINEQAIIDYLNNQNGE